MRETGRQDAANTTRLKKRTEYEGYSTDVAEHRKPVMESQKPAMKEGGRGMRIASVQYTLHSCAKSVII